MASWIAHMRIAEYFINKYETLNNLSFLVGSIAPDCGVPNDDSTDYTPKKYITHWFNGTDFDVNDFRMKHLQDKDTKFPFYLGYYFHLLLDREWTRFLNLKRNAPNETDRIIDKVLINAIKKDMDMQDRIFLRDNPNSIFFTVFAKIDAFPNYYFDFFPPDAFTKQIKNIVGIYLISYSNLYNEFYLVSKSDMDCFVKEAIASIEKIKLIEEL